MEGDRFERENRFACPVHGFNRVLEPGRGGGRAEVTVGVYDNCYTCWNGRPADALDKCGGCCTRRVEWVPAYANSVRFTCCPLTGDVDVMVARRGVSSRAASCVELERTATVGRVLDALCVLEKRLSTDCRVAAADCIVHERVITQERVAVEGIAAFIANRSGLRRKRKARECKY